MIKWNKNNLKRKITTKNSTMDVVWMQHASSQGVFLLNIKTINNILSILKDKNKSFPLMPRVVKTFNSEMSGDASLDHLWNCKGVTAKQQRVKTDNKL